MSLPPLLHPAPRWSSRHRRHGRGHRPGYAQHQPLEHIRDAANAVAHEYSVNIECAVRRALVEHVEVAEQSALRAPIRGAHSRALL